MNREERRKNAAKQRPSNSKSSKDGAAKGRAYTTDARPTFEAASVSSGEDTSLASASSRSLFHYTNAHGLIGILRSGSLWATHSNFTNDAAECQIMAEVLKPQIAEETEVLIEKLIERKLLREDVRTQRDIADQQAQAALNALQGAQRNISPIYICSFCHHTEGSAEYDHGLLSQWRGYGNGFAIEFDELKIDRLAFLEGQKHHYQGVLTDAVEYYDHKARAKLDNLKGIASAVNRKLFERSGQVYDDIFGPHQFDAEYVKAYLGPLPFLKHPGFSAENEYRIAALADRPRTSDVPDGKTFKKVHFRSNAGTGIVTPYIELFSDLNEPLPIKSILVGPHSNQDHQEEAIELLLEQYAPGIEVRRSGLTFRNL
ncbi:DUF2971 domain-containing protein [Tardiphaga sp. 215_C5_N2_1]|jgi:hypothetical protein|uniref:DUF2971 domain-containing protein n=1 Tax=unclassified Tardiphaga TaxID=2631404 RepID=UPI003F8A2A2B